MTQEKNMMGWFEIPVVDMQRAMTFYQNVLGITLSLNKLGDVEMAWFPMLMDKPGAPGALVKHEMYVPSEQGVVIYFTTPSGDLEKDAQSVVAAGGSVLVPRTAIGDGKHGYFMMVKDTEGNRVALHSMT